MWVVCAGWRLWAENEVTTVFQFCKNILNQSDMTVGAKNYFLTFRKQIPLSLHFFIFLPLLLLVPWVAGRKFRSRKCSGFHCQDDHTDSTEKWPRNVCNISESAHIDGLGRAQTHGSYVRISQSALMFVSSCFFPDDLILQPSPTACTGNFCSREMWGPKRTVVPVKKFNIYVHDWIRRRLELQYSDIGLVFVICVTSRHPHNRHCL